MHDRRSEYARCTRALVEDGERDGTSGIFDAALTNGLAAIVATRWLGQEADARGRMKSASALIDVIEAQSGVQANGVYELPDLDPPRPGGDVFGPPLGPSPTVIDPTVLREAIRRTQVIRHARAEPARPLEEEHVNALVALNADSALRVSLERGEDVDEYEERVLLADAFERARARAYLDLLSVDEMERRTSVDYEEEYLEIEDEDRNNTPHECPVCGVIALIERELDSYVGEYPAGTCVACSYVKSFDIADFEGRDEAIRRAVEDPRR
jgi:hypothetical protein